MHKTPAQATGTTRSRTTPRQARLAIFAATAAITLSAFGAPAASATPAGTPVRTPDASQSARTAAPAAPARAVPKKKAVKFTKQWFKAANNRNWKWIRAHSVMMTAGSYSGVSLREIRWSTRTYGKLTFGQCSTDYVEHPATTIGCWSNRNPSNILITMRNGRLVAAAFWDED